MTRARLAAALFLACGTLARGTDEPLPSLEPGAAVERDLASGDTHSYVVAPAEGDFVRVRVRTTIVDLAVRLARGDETIGEDPGQEIGSARVVSFVAQGGGTYLLQVRATSPAGTQGRYRLSVAAWRPASAHDAALAEADRTANEAHARQREGTQAALQQAEDLYRRALPIWRARGEAVDEADLLCALGETAYGLGDPEQARGLFEQELLLRRGLDDPQALATALNNLGVMLSVRGFRTEAVERFCEALPLQRAALDTYGEGQTVRNLAVAWIMLDEYQNALEALRASLELRARSGDKSGEGYTLHSLGGLYYRIGEFDLALDYGQRALAVRRELGERRAEAQTLESIGLVYSMRGDMPQARAYLEQAAVIVQETGDPVSAAWSQHNLGLTYAASDPARALEYYERALTLVRNMQDRPVEGTVLRAMARAQLQLGDVAAARQQLDESLLAMREIGDALGESATLHVLGRLERDHGDLERARQSFEAALAIVDRVRIKVARRDLRQVFTGSRQRLNEDYVELLMTAFRRKADPAAAAAAFAAAEHGRARSLRDILQEAGADPERGLDAALAERLRQVQERLNAREQERARVFGSRASDGDKARARAALESALAEYQEAAADAARANPRLAALQHPRPPTAGELQALLDPDTLLLEYALGERRSYLFVVTRDGVVPLELPPRAEVEALARRFREQLAASQRTAARGATNTGARELARLLLGPAVPWLADRRLVVVPDGALHLIPFAALADLRSGRPLVVEHEIVQLPALAVVAQLRADADARGRLLATRPEGPRRRDVAVIADPVLAAGDPRVRRTGPTPVPANAAQTLVEQARAAALTRSFDDVGSAPFARLTFSRREAEAIRATVTPRAAIVALDFDASRETVMSGALGNARIVHFATHALMNGRHPELSGLVLSLVDAQGRPQDGFVRLHDVYNLQLEADLVVLSACRTAVGREVSGEGVVSLTRGFMYAGAPRVMASLWDVRDDASAELMKRFYTGLVRRKLRPSAALREAQIALLNEPRWSAPFYWAGFVLQGEWR